MMSGDLVAFCLMGGVATQHGCNGKPVAPKFSRPIRMLDSFTKHFVRKVSTSVVV